MRLSCEVNVYKFRRGFGTLPLYSLCINKPIICLTNTLNGSIHVKVYNCSVFVCEYVITQTILFCS